MNVVTLSQLVDCGVDAQIFGDAKTAIHGVQHDSRLVVPGDLFVAIPGAVHDGSSFIQDALARGAVAIASEAALQFDVAHLRVHNARRAIGPIASRVYGAPTQAMHVAGVTGTNGKTTVSYLLEQVLCRLGRRVGVVGTVELRGPKGVYEASHTTPEADDLMRFCRELVEAQTSHLVMEVSSHGLAQHRVDGVDFDVVAFTNLTQDHLDFHGTLEAYGAAKARLFRDFEAPVAVCNVSDSFGAALAAEFPRRCIRCAVSSLHCAQVDLTLRNVKMHRSGLSGEFVGPLLAAPLGFRSPLVGEHNLENLLLAFGMAIGLAQNPKDIVQALGDAAGAPGRLELVPHPEDVSVYVDYAHTPDALKRVLKALRSITPGRLIVVFGCGGDRDMTKRAPMGRVAALGADLCYLTSDNPRTEDPERILDDVEEGLRSGGLSRGDARLGREEAREPTRSGVFFRESERRTAIHRALEAATSGDTVLIAGKGHEAYQVLGKERVPFDDQNEAALAIQALTAASSRQGGR
ncbi:MAG: UDP-N-acetylmuramoyl-L-alanyl-D-glutamate--2,6-diaminopimelate ligase [Myxococcota bacterium]